MTKTTSKEHFLVKVVHEGEPCYLEAHFCHGVLMGVVPYEIAAWGTSFASLQEAMLAVKEWRKDDPTRVCGIERVTTMVTVEVVAIVP